MRCRKAGNKQAKESMFFFCREDFVKLPMLIFLIWAEAKTMKQAEDQGMEKLNRSGLHKSKWNHVEAMRLSFQYCIQLLATQIWWLSWRRRKRIQFNFLDLEFVFVRLKFESHGSLQRIPLWCLRFLSPQLTPHFLNWLTNRKCYPIGFTLFSSSFLS